MNTDLTKAELWAKLAFFNQCDKAGAPMINHMARVASRLETPNEQIVAWLHDTVEDGHFSMNELILGFSPTIVDAVDAITRRKGEDYAQYLARIAANKLALTVKLADLEDNSDEARLALLPEDVADRLRKKYAAAKLALSGTQAAKIALAGTR